MIPTSSPQDIPRPHQAMEWAAQVGTVMDTMLQDILGESRRNDFSGVLVDELRTFTRRPGKRVRPLLLLHAYRAFSGREPGTEIFKIAAALELLHVFILAHDDVVDRSDSRGGQPTLHRAIEPRVGVHHDRERIAQSLAIVLGDMLFASAQRVVLRADLPADTRLRVLDHMLGFMTATGSGECNDILAGAWDISRITPSDVEHMYWLKTSLYTMECPLVLGAILAGCPDSVMDQLRDLSRPLGLAFQIHNDLKALREYDSPACSIPDDFIEGKKTLLMATTHQRLDPTDRRLLQLCLGQQPAGDAALATMIGLVHKSGAAGVLATRVASLATEATDRLAAMPWPADQRAALCAALQFLGSVLDCHSLASEAAA